MQAPQARTTLEGRTNRPDFVPAYLRQLSAEPALAGQRFDLFEIERAPQRGAPLRFALNRLPGFSRGPGVVAVAVVLAGDRN